MRKTTVSTKIGVRIMPIAYSQAKGYLGLQLWDYIVHNCLVDKGYNTVTKKLIQYNPFPSMQINSSKPTQVNEKQITLIPVHGLLKNL